MKKVIGLALVAVLSLGLVAPAFAAGGHGGWHGGRGGWHGGGGHGWHGGGGHGWHGGGGHGWHGGGGHGWRGGRWPGWWGPGALVGGLLARPAIAAATAPQPVYPPPVHPD